VPRGAERINLLGKTIIPGLIDADAMVERWALPRYVAWGVTSVRGVHSPGDSGFALKKDVDLGSIVGPRVRIGRNDSCICGSGTKFKKCCSSLAWKDLSDATRMSCPAGNSSVWRSHGH